MDDGVLAFFFHGPKVNGPAGSAHASRFADVFYTNDSECTLALNVCKSAAVIMWIILCCREDEILNRLTPNLRAEVTHFAHHDTVRLLKRMKLFENLDDSLLTRIIVALSTEFLPPDELVCAEGELGEVLYIIRKGVVSV